MAIRPGYLDTDHGGSTPDDFAASVAGAMEQKVHDLVLALTGKAPFDVSRDDPDARARRVLFVAIAEAVFEHLRDHASSLQIAAWGSDDLRHSHGISVQVEES